MVYQPALDDHDRPRGILSPADRQYLTSDKSGYTYQAQHKRENVIRERVVNGLLDFALLEQHLDDDQRDDIFGAFDLHQPPDEDETGGPFTDSVVYATCISDLIAFLYRGLRMETSHHPPFESALETGVVQGEFEPGTTYYGRYSIDITFEQHSTEHVNIPSVIERLQAETVDTLTEGETRVLLELLARSNRASIDELGDEFERWVADYEAEYELSPSGIGQLLAHIDNEDPFGLPDMPATGEVETVDDVDTAAAQQQLTDGEDLSPLELKALVESGEYELRPTES